MKKRKEGNIEQQRAVYSTVYRTAFSKAHRTVSTAHITVYSTAHRTVYSTVYGTKHSLRYNLQHSQMGFMSMALVYLLFLPAVFVYFLHITLLILKIKNSSMKNNHQNDAIRFRKIYNKMSSFDWKKNIEDSLRDGLIIAIEATGIIFGLNVANVKPPKASLDAMDIMKLAGGICGGGICGGVLVKDYAVYKKWVNE